MKDDGCTAGITGVVLFLAEYIVTISNIDDRCHIVSM
jgi:hypothetical protein